MSNNLYDGQCFFRLHIDEEYFYIDEPIGWDNVSLKLERDMTWFGFKMDFVDDETALKFPDSDDAFFVIKDLYDEKGSDAVCYLEFGIVSGNTPLLQYKGLVNLNTYVNEDQMISCSVDKVEFNNDFRSKFDVKVDLTALKSLDESVVVVPSTPIEISLHSKAIFKQFVSEMEQAISFDSGNIARFFALKFDSTIEIVSELEGNQNLPLSINGINPVEQGLYFFKTTEAGKYNIRSNYSFVFTIIRKPATFPIGNYAGVIRLRIFRAGAAIYDYEIDSFSGSHSGTTKGIYLTHSFEYLALDILKDDLFYFYMDGACQYAGSTYQYLTTDFVCKIEIEALTDAPETIAKGYPSFDVLTKLVEYTTNQMLAVKSDWLETGFGAKLALIYGFALRGFEPEKPFITSLSDFLNSFNAISCMGLGFKRENDIDSIIFEPMEKFFEGELMLKIGNVSKYKEEQAREFVFNEVELGYEKFEENQANTLDEFNTYYQWLNPIKTFKQKLSKKSKYIASGYSIETLRREQFKENPSNSLSNDDEIFIISTIETTGSTRDAERDENFSDVTGLISPETTYNLTISPKRNFWAWARYLLIGLYLKPDTELVKNTFIKNNDKLISTSNYVGGDRRNEPTEPLVEKENISLEKLRELEAIHLPRWATFETELTYSTIIALRSYLTGEGTNTKNFGFIQHPDDKNILWYSHIYSIAYNPSTCIAQFKVAKIKLAD